MESTQTNQTENCGYITYENYSNSRLSCTPSEQKTIPGTGPQATPPSAPQYYYQIPLMYNLGTDEKKILNDCLIEGCEVTTTFGIQSKPGQSGRLEHSVMVKFDLNNESHQRFLETMSQLHGGCAFILGTMKGAVKLYNFNPQMAEATGLKSLIYRPRDELTGEYIQGRSPSMFFKLFSRGTAPMVEQTLFTGLDGKAIDWKLMANVQMSFIPLIHIKRMYIGGRGASIQMEVISAVVTSIEPRNSTTRQLGTIHRLQSIRPELVDKVAGQLSRLMTDRQDQLVDPNQKPPNTLTEKDTPTWDGISASANKYISQSSVPPLPVIQPIQNNLSITDFVSSAPTRPPVIPGVTLTTSSSEETPVHLKYN